MRGGWFHFLGSLDAYSDHNTMRTALHPACPALLHVNQIRVQMIVSGTYCERGQLPGESTIL